MASSMERSSSRRSSTPFMPRSIVIAFDATKIRDIQELKQIISNIRLHDDMIQEAATIKLLGVLHKVLHPMGFQIQIGPKSFVGAHFRAIEEDVSRKVDEYVHTLQHTAEECEAEGVNIEVNISAGAPIKKVVVQEVVALNPTWAIIDRHLRKELRFYIQHIPCKVAHVVDNLCLQVLRSYRLDKSTDTIKNNLVYSLSKPVSPPPPPDNESDKQSVVSVPANSPRSSDISKSSMMSSATAYAEEPRNDFDSNDHQETSAGSQHELENKHDESPEKMQKEISLQNHSGNPVSCSASEIKTGQDSMGCSYSDAPDKLSSVDSVEEGTKAKVKIKQDVSPPVNQRQTSLQIHPDVMKKDLDSMGFTFSMIKTATNNFSPDNLLREGDYGVVYKGRLKNGQLIAVKVQKDANKRPSAEFRSEIYVLSIVRHKNIEMLLGYCCKENLDILVYEYICNKSLEWHLFDNKEHVLDWHQRYAIAVGTAKGLQFLHEECRGSPLVHQDIRPSNILLTDDFIPLLGDCGLAKWKTNKDDIQTRLVDNLAYLAPERAEKGVSSVKTDVYALGIVLIQLISGRKPDSSTTDNRQKNLKQWALPLIQTLAFDELVDPRLEYSYDTYELYNMARAAYSCVQTKPSMRPTIGEVLCILEGTNDLRRHLKSNLYPIILNTEASP
ncbi:probable receptor-like protein kinase At3g17420 isoform X1 [Sesamum indicum]|uniref:Probable receptor-like protein kinase At3g17420 isoform X1 n=1 Tax=Sesamum indicum TaxID=4182 RepID=A0A8M8UP04_SESIN|nr:probable receptor-like protein kinase At3g17420 isoform X1 [Sesamum indicum]